MALLYLNSFDGSGTPGRHGDGGTGSLLESFGALDQLFMAGMWFKNSMDLGPKHFQFHQGFSVGFLATTSDGSFRYSVRAGPTYYSENDLWRANIWHFIELEVFLDTAAGYIKAYLDDPGHVAPVLDIIGVPTIDGSYVDLINSLFWGGVSAGGGAYDDLYAADSAVVDPFGNASPSTPLGAIQVIRTRPNGAGDKAEWTPDPAVANYLNVDDAIADGDTTVNLAIASAVGDEDLHEIEDVSTGDTALGMHVKAKSRKTSDGIGRVALLAKHDGVTYDLDDQLLLDTFSYATHVALGAMPNGDPLTDANLNALQLGYRRTR